MALLVHILVGLGDPMRGLGIDWGTTFSSVRTMDHKSDNGDSMVNACHINEKVLITRTGSCSFFSACKVNRVSYFGSYCDNSVRGSPCRVETEQFLTVEGTCSHGGHCHGHQGQLALHHESCKNKNKKDADEREEETKRTPAKQLEFSEKSMLAYSKCKLLYKPSVYYRLKNICEDCYNLFKNHEVHILCTSECFGSFFFLSCTKRLMLELDKDMVVS